MRSRPDIDEDEEGDETGILGFNIGAPRPGTAAATTDVSGKSADDSGEHSPKPATDSPNTTGVPAEALTPQTTEGGRMSTSEQGGQAGRTAPQQGQAAQGQQQEGMRVRWDDTQMKSSYANVCNVASTREEVVFLFGTNQAWHAGQREIPVQLTDRIIMSPHAAKRLSVLLDNVLKEYENRFGKLPDPRGQQ